MSEFLTQDIVPDDDNKITLGRSDKRFAEVNAVAATITTVTGNLVGNVTGNVTPTTVVVPNVTVGDTATYALAAADSGGVWVATKASATQTYTLPAVAEGLTYTFICGHASGEILVNPTGAAPTFIGTGFATAAGVGIKNTAATNVVGDAVTVVSDGTHWYATNVQGTWATQ